MYFLLLVLTVLLTGCPEQKQPQAGSGKIEPTTESRPSVTLRLAVVNDEALATAIGRLRGEWAERSGGTLETKPIAWQDLIAAESPDADVILFPSRYLGELCEKKWLRPVRDNVLQSGAFNAADIYPLVRQRLITYDKQTYAVPLGIDLPVMSYGGLQQVVAPVQIPNTWSEYLGYLQRKVERPTTILSPTWEPIRSWGAVLLLSRAASYSADTSGNALFDLQTMQPHITGPAFLRAAQELKDIAAISPPPRESASELDRNLQDPRAASFYTARSGCLAIGLPPAGHRNLSIPDDKLQPLPGGVRWTHLPGASEKFDSLRGWQRVEGTHRSPVLGFGDRLAAVSTSTHNAASAFQLLQWLVQSDVSSQFARASEGTMPVRPSLAKSQLWYDEKVNAQERADLATVLGETLSSEECLMIPRIPGVDEYMLALGEAVEDVVSEDAEPKAALEKAASTWELITEKRGREAQRKAYLRHLGLDEKL